MESKTRPEGLTLKALSGLPSTCISLGMLKVFSLVARMALTLTLSLAIKKARLLPLAMISAWSEFSTIPASMALNLELIALMENM